MRISLRAAAGLASVVLSSVPATAQATPGDDCFTPLAITDSGTQDVISTVAFNSVGFTSTGLAPTTCNPGTTDPTDIWFLYTAGVTGTATFSLCPCSTLCAGGSVITGAPGGGGAAFDSVLTAYDAGACPPTVVLSCQDGAPDCGAALQSEVSFAVVAGNQYFVQIGDWNNGTTGFSGTLAYVVRNPVAPPTPPVPPSPAALWQTLPSGFEAANTGFFSNNPFGLGYACANPAATGMIHQYCFDTSMISYPGLQRITALGFRINSGLVSNGGTVNNVDIRMTSSPNDMLLLSNTFASNRGADYTLVYSGSITFPAGNPTTFGYANGYWVMLQLQTPFDYDPTLGKDLLVEVTTNDVNQLRATGIEVSLGPTRTQANTLSAAALTSNSGLVTAALLRMDYQPLPYLQVSTLGGGAGDIAVSLADIPAGMTQGWTLISTLTSFSVGTGPIVGIYPSQTMFDVLSFTPSFGNPLAWVAGAPPGLYPTSPFVAPPGTLSFLAGQIWDFVTFGFDGIGYAGRSNVVRVTW